MTSTSIPALPEDCWRMHPSKLAVVRAVGRRMVPYLIEATVIPTVLFYAFYMAFELKWAIAAALCWTYAALGRRIVLGRRVPGLLILATLGVTARTAIFLLNQNDFVYFFQPILRTVATAALFAVSVVIGRPLIARFAGDFCPLTADVQNRPAIIQLFRRLTYLWALVNFTAAAASLALLLTLPVGLFVGATAVSAWLITGTGVVLTVSESVRTARLEGLATAVAPNGTLRAYVAD
jgi:intracellular septation protein A